MKYTTTATITFEVPDDDVTDWTLEQVEANVREAISDCTEFIEHGEYVHVETSLESTPTKYVGFTSVRGNRIHTNARCGTGRSFVSGPTVVSDDDGHVLCGRCATAGLVTATEASVALAVKEYGKVLRKYNPSTDVDRHLMETMVKLQEKIQ